MRVEIWPLMDEAEDMRKDDRDVWALEYIALPTAR